MYSCILDHSSFDNLKDLHYHINKVHGIKIKEYYETHLARKDLLTGEPIVYKDPESYIHSFFNNRTNLVDYFKNLSKNDLQKIATEVLKERKLAKNLKFAPSTVEARTSILPSPFLLESKELNYNQICKDLGFICRYDYSQIVEINEGKLEIIMDSREQHPLTLGAKIIKSKLDIGDYTCKNKFNNVFIERKSVNDLCGTLSQGYERFNREISRAIDLEAYLVVSVEESFNDFINYHNKSHNKHIKAHPEFICKRMRTLCENYDNIQFLFCNGRREMSRLVEKIFSLSNNIRELDLQFLYDCSKI